MLGLQYFSFEELWTPWFLFFMIAVVILYFYLIGPWREKHAPHADKATVWQKIMFVSAAVMFYLVQGGPFSLLGHMMFTFHMIDMSVSYLIVPPMLLLSVPAFIWQRMLAAQGWKKLRFMTHPIAAILTFNMLFSLYHVPLLNDYVMTHFWLHRLVYFILLVAAMLMWAQIANPVPEWNRLTDLKKMAYVFANGVLLTPACAFIIFAKDPMYAVYSDPTVWVKAMGYCVNNPSQLLVLFDGPQFFNILSSPEEDQQLGGIVMKLLQEFMYGVILAYIFFHWFKREHKDDDVTNATNETPIDLSNMNKGTV
ncbi:MULTISPECIES: cytochrome c oxidase assembly factor CtaG [unclassified Paenibacillus]|uniref:cytochrome c oxidase assembly factor CtaG n=1 Tax=unclassified Paenibacillus TaxID=185978 RepID=UPI0010459B41|nr:MULTISPECIES: cytochrome c oxidase assembly factor CtaG [unclassified Paenibacillus]NIK70776.1 putative membrane protein [Paenibacillus sp. BK720]TCM93252.1 putative membrane protein [Paenibacillus sp. BK033]